MSDRRDELKCVIKDFDEVLQPQREVKHANKKLHATENQHASFHRHMSATDHKWSIPCNRQRLDGYIKGRNSNPYND